MVGVGVVELVVVGVVSSFATSLIGWLSRRKLVKCVMSSKELIDVISEKGVDLTHGSMEAYILKTYEKIGKLGEGASGIVERVKNISTGEVMALKTISKSNGGINDQEEVDTEIRCLRRLRHRNIVNLVEAVESDSHIWIVMECADGGGLYDRIISLDHFSEKAAAGIIKQVLQAVHYMHSMGVVHRDLKPENVVLTHYGRSLRAKLTDFGLSRIGAESTGAWTLQAAPPGTAHYIAPEVVLQKRYGFQADLYSLGVLFWTVLTGGLVDSPGIPPCIRVEQHFAGFAPYKENWKLIRNCVRDPYSNGARPMPCAGSGDLVLKLTRENPQARLDYVALRKHPYTRQMSLPPADAQRDVIETWLQQYEEALALEETSTRLSADDAGAPSDTPDVAAGPDEFTLDLPVVMEESMIASDASTGEGGSSEVFSTANATAADNDA
mmetsp:Transcript_144713/g.277791  ORF Transcript_144713/g.277791 Transcript_144713/m.277791 type:complete len:439 (-) Transcript_144713:102-1418(-)